MGSWSVARKHGHGTRGAAPASDAGRGCPRVGPRLCFFFFFFLGFAPTRLDSRRCGSICADSAPFAPMRPNRADSAKIGPYRPYRFVSAGGRYGRNRPKNGRNRPETAEIGLEYGCQSRNLHSSFFFCESRHSMCFLRIF